LSIALGFLVLIGLSACGASDKNSAVTPTPTVEEEATPIASDPIASCWSSDQLITEGTNDVPGQQWSSAPEMQIDANATYKATFNTTKGTFTAELLASDAPITVNNFVCLARAGYFDGTPFHRIIDGFVIQGGDPTGTGTGGPGYRFQDEPVTREYVKGTLAMANAGPNTNGSQFFVVLADLRGRLPKNYTIFGQVTDGLDVVEALGKTPTTTNARGEKSVPTEPVNLDSVTIEEIAAE
jgi:cyclophilin family peptidyl-prolyl cis-trans isomerase